MTELIDLNSHRPPVVYGVTIVHHWDDTLEFHIHDVADDPRSRASVMDAFRRICGAADRIEELEDALKKIALHDMQAIALRALSKGEKP